MSAIFGLWHRDGTHVQEESLDRAMSALSHRFSGGALFLRHGAIGVGQGMPENAAPEVQERLPSEEIASGLKIVFDGRLDNRDELILVLVRDQGEKRSQLTDEALILMAYSRWGEHCPRHLIGDFAFGLWDGRRRRWLCARDPMGVRPLYYFHDDDRFVFASEIKALLSLPLTPRRINERRIADHLAGQHDDKTATFYASIMRLPAGHCITIGEKGDARAVDYWPLEATEDLRLDSDEAYAEAFRERFEQAVACRLTGPGPHGALLSGGLDSSSIVCAARNRLAADGRGPIRAFSAVFPGLPPDALRRIDERAWIQAVVQTGGIEQHCLHADRLGPWEDLDRMLCQEDEPFFGPNLYLHWGLHRLARQAGVRVLLDGIDGDSCVGHGLDHLTDLARKGRWIRLADEARGLARRRNQKLTGSRIMWECGFRPLIPSPMLALWGRLRGRPDAAQAASSVIDPAFLRRMGAGSAGFRDSTQPTPRTMRQKHIASLRSPGMTEVLELADRSASAAGIEPRYPFFDRRLIEFCVSLPPDQHLNQGWTRIVQRRAMQSLLPESVCWRFLKSNLSPNFLHHMSAEEGPRLARDERLRDWRIWDYVHRPAFEEALHRLIGHAHPRPADAYLIHRTVVLNRWLQLAFG